MQIIEQWLLFKYVEGQFTPLSKPFKTKEQAREGAFETPGAGAADGAASKRYLLAWAVYPLHIPTGVPSHLM
jgi:hypothetical protein